MRRLTKNYYRFGWVLLTNGAVILLFLSGPIRAHHNQELLYQVMRTNAPAFSYFREFFSDPWVPILVITLLGGILADARRAVLSPILNLGPYVVWLLTALWERAKVTDEATPYELYVGKVLLIIPLILVIAINLIFYLAAFRRSQAEDGADTTL